MEEKTAIMAQRYSFVSSDKTTISFSVIKHCKHDGLLHILTTIFLVWFFFKNWEMNGDFTYSANDQW